MRRWAKGRKAAGLAPVTWLLRFMGCSLTLITPMATQAQNSLYYALRVLLGAVRSPNAILLFKFIEHQLHTKKHARRRGRVDK